MHVLAVQCHLHQLEPGSRICGPERHKHDLRDLLVLLKLLERLPPRETGRQLELVRLCKEAASDWAMPAGGGGWLNILL